MNKHKRILHVFIGMIIILSSLTLPACGGGGDGDDTNKSQASPSLNWDKGNWNEKNWQ